MYSNSFGGRFIYPGTSEDPGYCPHPSIWNTKELNHMLEITNGYTISFDQCMFGSANLKPTTIATNILGAKHIGKRCDHSFKHAPLIGRQKGRNGFCTAHAQVYGRGLCEALATLFFLEPKCARDLLGAPKGFEGPICDSEDDVKQAWVGEGGSAGFEPLSIHRSIG